MGDEDEELLAGNDEAVAVDVGADVESDRAIVDRPGLGAQQKRKTSDLR
jgi:hypothetical protein